jgi:hypothetical protein
MLQPMNKRPPASTAAPTRKFECGQYAAPAASLAASRSRSRYLCQDCLLGYFALSFVFNLIRLKEPHGTGR